MTYYQKLDKIKAELWGLQVTAECMQYHDAGAALTVEMARLQKHMDGINVAIAGTELPE